MGTTKKAAATKKVKAEDEPSTSEEMAAEANPPKKPDGSPPLVPFAALPRRAKAKFFAPFRSVLDNGDILEGKGNVAAQASVVYEVLADVEDALRIIAADNDAMDTWMTEAPDEALLELLFWYADRFQVGEASASST